MAHITKETIERLSAQSGAPAISIYVPTHKHASSVSMSQDETRFKNALADIEKKLEPEHGPRTISNLLKPAQRLLGDLRFWQHQQNGLAVFINQDGMETVKLPHCVQEMRLVDDHFVTTPLIAMAEDNQPFYILVLRKQQPQLYRADRAEIKPAAQARLPEDMETALNIDEYKPDLQFHGSNGSRAVFHGHDENNRMLNDLRHYLHHIDRGIEPELHNRRDPLILAGIDDETGEFRRLSHYDHIAVDTLGEPDQHVGMQDLLEQGWEIIAKLQAQRRRKAVERYQQIAGSVPERAPKTIKGIAQAARDGRVDTLLVGVMELTRDHVYQHDEQVRVYALPETVYLQQIDEAVRETWAKGGTIIPLETRMMPSDDVLAAILRY